MKKKTVRKRFDISKSTGVVLLNQAPINKDLS